MTGINARDVLRFKKRITLKMNEAKQSEANIYFMGIRFLNRKNGSVRCLPQMCPCDMCPRRARGRKREKDSKRCNRKKVSDTVETRITVKSQKHKEGTPNQTVVVYIIKTNETETHINHPTTE